MRKEDTGHFSIVESIGNLELLNLQKTTFLSSRSIPASCILKCYDWATSYRDEKSCVISGFHSQIEKDVLHYLLQSRQSVVLVLARGMLKRIDKKLKIAMDTGNLLIVTPFVRAVSSITEETALKRNEFMIGLADKVVIAYAKKGGLLEKLMLKFSDKDILMLSG